MRTGYRSASVRDITRDVTSGSQVIESCRELRDREANIAAVLCVIDREAGGPEHLATESLGLGALFTMSQFRRGRATDPIRS